MADSTTHDIVILGGSFAGLGLAHGLIKALPGLRSSTGKKFRVVMISNSSHFWYICAAPRAMLKPFPNDIMDSFIPISKGFSKYPSSDFQFVFGEITGVNTETHQVQYRAKKENEEHEDATSTQAYGTLVVATGSTAPSPLYSVHGGHVPTLEAYKEMQAQMPQAKSVIVVGGGTAGVETTGEIANLYGKGTSEPKDITIYSGTSRLLSALQPGIGASAEKILSDMGVKTVHTARLESSNKLPTGQTEVKFDNGDTKTVDVLIVATGRRPSAPFLPSTIPWTENGRIETDAYMRVTSQEGIYAIGDVTSQSNGTIMFIKFANNLVVGNIVAELSGKGKGKEYKPLTTKDMQIVPIGPNNGVGAAFGWRIPAFLVRMIKGKDMMFGQAMSTVVA